MAEIRIFNDGKEKRQSWEAHLTLGEDNFPVTDYNVELSGYGADEAEARQNLALQLRLLQREVESSHALFNTEIREPKVGDKTFSLDEGNGTILSIVDKVVTIYFGNDDEAAASELLISDLAWVEDKNYWQYGDMECK